MRIDIDELMLFLVSILEISNGREYDYFVDIDYGIINDSGETINKYNYSLVSMDDSIDVPIMVSIVIDKNDLLKLNNSDSKLYIPLDGVIDIFIRKIFYYPFLMKMLNLMMELEDNGIKELTTDLYEQIYTKLILYMVKVDSIEKIKQLHFQTKPQHLN